MGTQNRSRGARRYTVEPNSDFLVRRAGVEDALQIADVHVAAWRETYGPLLPAGALDSLDAGGESSEVGRDHRRGVSLCRLSTPRPVFSSACVALPG